jgi:uncharacterized protein with GYD domain
MLYLTMLRISPTRNRDAFNELRRLRSNHQVSIVAKYRLFGTPDAVVVYEAPNNESAMDFLSDTLCALPGVTDTETYSAIDVR